MDPKERFTAKQALMHKFFDGLRSKDEEEAIKEQREKEKGLRRVESSTHPRNGSISRNGNGDLSRSRSGLRNNKVIKANNQKRLQQQGPDPL